MVIDVNSTTPIYIQVAELIQNMILEGSIGEEEQIPSTTQLSQYHQLNPATVRKGFNILTDSDLIYKKRGLGMFVKEGATEMIREKRKQSFLKEFITPMLVEGKKIGMEANDIIKLIELSKEEHKNG